MQAWLQTSLFQGHAERHWYRCIH